MRDISKNNVKTAMKYSSNKMINKYKQMLLQIVNG